MLNIVIASLLICLVSGCEASHSFTSSNCVFYMNYTDSNCTTFNFIRCTWYDCLAQPNITNALGCIAYGTIASSDWNKCTSTCCSSGGILPQTYETINQCRNQAQNNAKNVIVIVCTTLAIALLIIFLVIIYCRSLCSICFDKIKYCITCRCFLNSQQNVNRELKCQSSNKIIPQKFDWIQSDTQKILCKTTICSVCLEEGCFFELDCNHIFHAQCIITCLQKKMACILCRNAHLKKARVYCQNCFKYYYQISISSIINSWMYAQRICENCKTQEINYASLK